MTTRISMSCNLPPQGLLVLMPSSQVMSVTQLAQMTVQFAIDNGTGTGNGKFIMLKLKQLSIKHGKTIAYAKYTVNSKHQNTVIPHPPQLNPALLPVTRLLMRASDPDAKLFCCVCVCVCACALLAAHGPQS